MKFQELAVLITKKEGKKSQVNIAQVNEILSCLKAIMHKKPLEVFEAMGFLAETGGKKKKGK